MTQRPRIDLASAIPLSSPMAMWVEPTNVCNFKCTFCPEAFPDYSKQAGYYEKMSYATWRKVWESLQQWPALKALRLYHVGEPLLNPILPDMIADGRMVADRVEIVTNGSLLAKRAKELVQAGLDDCWVSVYGVDADSYVKVTQSRFYAQAIRMGIQALKEARGTSHKPRIFAQLVVENPSPELVTKFETLFTDADECVVRDYLHNWGGSDSRLVQLGQKLDPKVICPQPFYQLAVKANGKVTVCCADWRNELIVERGKGAGNSCGTPLGKSGVHTSLQRLYGAI
jgi:uncharacterized Fe-S cluster-containing radical SAM superfamily protein